MTPIEEVKNRLSDLLKHRQDQLDRIRLESEKQAEIIRQAEEEMSKAQDGLDGDAFKSAKRKADEARLVIEMCTRQAEVISAQKLISESDSDEMIDKLLDYEKTLKKEYLANIDFDLESLRECTSKYQEMIRDIESTIILWTSNVHPNYRTFGRSMYHQPDGSTTDRSSTPKPVHPTAFLGCRTSIAVSDFFKELERVQALEERPY